MKTTSLCWGILSSIGAFGPYSVERLPKGRHWSCRAALPIHPSAIACPSTILFRFGCFLLLFCHTRCYRLPICYPVHLAVFFCFSVYTWLFSFAILFTLSCFLLLSCSYSVVFFCFLFTLGSFLGSPQFCLFFLWWSMFFNPSSVK